MVQKITIGILISVAFFYSMLLNAATLQPSAHHPVTQSKPIHHPVRHPKQPIKHTKHKHLPRSHPQPVHTATIASPSPSPSFISQISERMVRFVHSTISTLRYTAYQFGGTHFDSSKGIYILDCSDYVDHLLEVANPSAYHSLVRSTGSDKPTSEHYYHFFTGLTYKPRHYWNKVDSVSELRPGDILVFRNQSNSHTGVSGHVMVVMKKPTRIQNAFLVRVADAAASGHSQDTRLPHTSGIGIGTMQLKVNPSTGRPSAYAWKLGSTFEKHVNFAMARPMGH